MQIVEAARGLYLGALGPPGGRGETLLRKPSMLSNCRLIAGQGTGPFQPQTGPMR
jgi:hypothetical protein